MYFSPLKILSQTISGFRDDPIIEESMVKRSPSEQTAFLIASTDKFFPTPEGPFKIIN